MMNLKIYLWMNGGVNDMARLIVITSMILVCMVTYIIAIKGGNDDGKIG